MSITKFDVSQLTELVCKMNFFEGDLFVGQSWWKICSTVNTVFFFTGDFERCATKYSNGPKLKTFSLTYSPLLSYLLFYSAVYRSRLAILHFKNQHQEIKSGQIEDIGVCKETSMHNLKFQRHHHFFSIKKRNNSGCFEISMYLPINIPILLPKSWN